MAENLNQYGEEREGTSDTELDNVTMEDYSNNSIGYRRGEELNRLLEFQNKLIASGQYAPDPES